MSFAFASCNEYGIVISADRRLTSTLENGRQYTLTSTSRKLFLTAQGYAVTYTGCASVDGVPTPVIIQRVLSKLDTDMALSLFELFKRFTNKMSDICKENLIFIAAGYQSEEPCIFSSSTQKPEIVRFSGTCFSGESIVGKALLDILPRDYGEMTLQDRVDFHRFITATIYRLQLFSQQLPTVSSDCDIAVIGPDGVVFSEFSKLH